VGKGGLSFLPLFAKRASAVILSAAGAKDLLSRRCEGPAFGEDMRAQRSFASKG